MAQTRNSEVGPTVAALNLASWNDHVVIDSRKSLFLWRVGFRNVRFCMEIGHTYGASGKGGGLQPGSPPPSPQSEN